MAKVKVKARVKVTIEIDVSDSWGGDCALEQVHSQAKKSALDRLTLARDIGGGLREVQDITLVGDMSVVAVLVEDGKASW